MTRNRDDYSSDPLTDEERREIRRIIEGDRNWRWLGALARRIGLWVGGVVGGIILLRDLIRDTWRLLFG